MNNAMLKASLAELVGTFILTFIGGAAVVAAGGNVVIPALAHGLALLFIVYTYGHISGAHVNPAVTLGLLVGRQIEAMKAVAYWVAQFAGAILAALLLSVILGAGKVGETTGPLTTSSVWLAALFEAVMTFFLVSTVYQAAVYGKAGNLAGVAIGLTLGASILAGGTFTGASLNPARTLGPALVAGHLDYVLPYFVGILGGGALAGLVHGYFFKDA